MDLQTVVKKVFGADFLQNAENKLLSKNNKKLFIEEIQLWLEEFIKGIKEPEVGNLIMVSSTSLSSESSTNNHQNYQSPGRLGTLEVGFTLDKSFGIVAINQEGLNVTAACRFATVSASCGVYSGKWMYELHLITNGIMQLGWCTNLCHFSVDRGCGDTDTSYAYDGSRHRSWNMISEEYGELWKVGDIIGLCINLDDAYIEFYRNGRSLGIAFRDIPTGSGIIYIPCISLIDTENVLANFGAKPLRHPVPDFQPLQKEPVEKITKAIYLFKWLTHLTNLVYPDFPKIANCYTSHDLEDSVFWRRMFYLLMYQLTPIFANDYCLFNNFIPFVEDLVDIKNEKRGYQVAKYHIVMDYMWMYIRERNLEKIFSTLINEIIQNFKQVSDNMLIPPKINEVKVCSVILSHEYSRKYIIGNLIDHKFDILKLMHHKPAEEQEGDNFLGDPWWDTKGAIPEIEKNKESFNNAFIQIEQVFEELEKHQCKLLRYLLINEDGNEFEASSRMQFLKKFRKFSASELEFTRSELRSKLNSHIAYASFQRMVRILLELWKEEVGNAPLVMPPVYFYDRSFNYQSCDRIGGLESYLVRSMREELVRELGENHRVFGRRFGDESVSGILQMNEFRALVNLLEGNDAAMENFLMPIPTTSNTHTPLLQAILTPLLRESSIERQTGNRENRITLLELFEDLIMFFTAAVAKHCHKFSNATLNFQKQAGEYIIMIQSLEALNPDENPDDPVVLTLQSTTDLLKKDLEKRAKKSAWIEAILLSPSRSRNIVVMFQSVVDTVCLAEQKGDLFVFLPDFYLDACYAFVQVIIRDFKWLEKDEPDIIPPLKSIASVMIKLIGDPRVKHIDSKKMPINILSVFVTTPPAVKVLEEIDPAVSWLLIQKLMEPYGDRHWKASNWILVRFWHGCGFAFRYSTLPHHSIDSDYLSAPNFVMYNITSSPSMFYQELIRKQLLDHGANIPSVMDSLISELHWCFGEFLTPMQELQRAIERNEQLLMMGRLYKMCSNYFDKTIALLRVLDMFIAVAPEIFGESYFLESSTFTRRIIQVVLLIIHRISTRQGCFRIVMNSRISVLENVEYFPIQSACAAILLGLVKYEMESFDDETLVVPRLCRMILRDASYDYDNLKILIGSPETKNSAVICLHDYEDVLIEPSELATARKFLFMMSKFFPMLSAVRVIPDDELCMICYMAPFDVKFSPCGHNSCLGCISYYIAKNRLCFFCKRTIEKVIMLDTDEVIPSLSE